MARDLLSVWLKLRFIFCFDEGDGWGDAEPYLWSVFFKVDGSTLRLTATGAIEGGAEVYPTPGSHGNLGGDIGSIEQRDIPPAIGEWQTFLSPIAVPAPLQGVLGAEDLPGVAGVVCILMEEDAVSDGGAEAGHRALNEGVAEAIDAIIQSLGPGHMLADITPQEIEGYFAPVRRQVEQAIRDHVKGAANIFAAIDPDDELGHVYWMFKHDDLAQSSGPIYVSEEWRHDCGFFDTDCLGSWGLWAQATATVACPADLLKALPSIFAELFPESSRSREAAAKQDSLWTQVRRLRQELATQPHLETWAALAARNTPQLLVAVKDDPSVQRSLAIVLEELARLIAEPESTVTPEFLHHTRRVLIGLSKTGSRRARIDASRALDAIAQTQGMTFAGVAELLASVPPRRHPERGQVVA